MTQSILFSLLLLLLLSVLSSSFSPHSQVGIRCQQKIAPWTIIFQSHNPTEGKMFDIDKGPGHHLIDVDKKDLEDLGDKSVEVHEMKVDAATVTLVSFGMLALFLFVMPFMNQ